MPELGAILRKVDSQDHEREWAATEHCERVLGRENQRIRFFFGSSRYGAADLVLRVSQTDPVGLDIALAPGQVDALIRVLKECRRRRNDGQTHGDQE